MRPLPEPLATHTTLGIGGPAEHYVAIHTLDELHRATRWARDRGLPIHILGGGSNLVIHDGGLSGLVIKLNLSTISKEQEGDRMRWRVAAGVLWDDLVAKTVLAGHAGLECLSGIPGLVGATPIQNVGAYGQSVSDTIHEVECLNLRDGSLTTFKGSACIFGYRQSRFKHVDAGRYAIVGVSFDLAAGGSPCLDYSELKDRLDAKPKLDTVRSAVLELRRRKSMVVASNDPNRRSCGSFFVNPIVEYEHFERLKTRASNMPHFPDTSGRVKLSAGWLIENSGFPRGTRRGNVGLSSRHALALVAHDQATAIEVVTFAREIQSRVRNEFQILLDPEPRFWGFEEFENGLPLV